MLHNLTIWRGGAERLLFTLSQNLRQLGYQVDIHVLMDSPDQCYPELREGLKVTATRGIACKKIFSAMPVIQALELAHEIIDKYDIIHAHNFPSHIAAFVASRNRNVPFVWQCNEPHRILHDTTERSFYIKRAIQERPANCIMELGALQLLKIAKTFDALAANRAFAVTALSNYESAILHDIYNITPIVIHPGADIALFSKNVDGRKVREEFEIGDAPLVLTVSRLWPAKNLETSLQAFRLVLKALPSAYYMIVGDGPSRRDLLELSHQLGIHGRCIFVGDHDVGDRINLFYAACDAYLSTAIGEPWGLTVLEAMQMAKPVVASSSGGVTDLIKDHKNGILANPLMPDDVAQRLMEVLTNSTLANKLGQAAASTASQYSWKKMARAYDVLYQEAINRNSEEKRMNIQSRRKMRRG